MKTPEDIKKSFRIHSLNNPSGCVGCKYRGETKIPGKCSRELFKDVREYIQQLETNVKILGNHVSLLQRDLERLERERDALFSIVKADAECCYCKHHEDCVSNFEPYTTDCGYCEKENCPCVGCTANNDHWEWIGVKEDEPT